MKKTTIFAIAAVIAMASAGTGLVLAANPSSTNGAQTYGWNLSGAVMPVPPYGQHDIPGSDTASKMLVNQPATSATVIANVTGVMNGLNPDTTYTVYVSKTYVPYTAANVAGSYKMDTIYKSGHYFYDLTLSQTGNALGGTLYDPYLPGTLDVTGTVSGNTVTFSVTYPGVQGVRTFVGTVASGNLSGSWSETGTENGSGTWSTTGGSATMASGSTGWPGLLPGMQTFTFTTDDSGSGSWHENLTSANILAGRSFSVWINGAGGTILVSDPVTLQ